MITANYIFVVPNNTISIYFEPSFMMRSAAIQHPFVAMDCRSSVGPSHRNSKLTKLLKDSLGGNSKTTMIANVGPANYVV